MLSNAIGSQAALTLDSAGNPHVLYKTSDAGASADNDLLAYATCTQPLRMFPPITGERSGQPQPSVR